MTGVTLFSLVPLTTWRGTHKISTSSSSLLLNFSWMYKRLKKISCDVHMICHLGEKTRINEWTFRLNYARENVAFWIYTTGKNITLSQHWRQGQISPLITYSWQEARMILCVQQMCTISKAFFLSDRIWGEMSKMWHIFLFFWSSAVQSEGDELFWATTHPYTLKTCITDLFTHLSFQVVFWRQFCPVETNLGQLTCSWK